MLGALERWVLRMGSRQRCEGAGAASPGDDISHLLFSSIKRESWWGPAQGCGRPQWDVAVGEGAERISFLCLGDVHVGMADRNGQLEVEVIQARGLIPKMGSKSIPGRWVGREGE